MKQFIIIAIAALSSMTIHAQDKDAATVQKIVESKNFIFKAQSATSQRGRLVQLTSDYDLSIKGDTVSAWLPFYGRAYTAPINPSDGGIKFTSTDFSYSAKKAKKDSWEIAIKPSDAREVQELNLSVYSSGSASLRVTNTNRDAMTYNGYIEEGQARGKRQESILILLAGGVI